MYVLLYWYKSTYLLYWYNSVRKRHGAHAHLMHRVARHLRMTHLLAYESTYVSIGTALVRICCITPRGIYRVLSLLALLVLNYK